MKSTLLMTGVLFAGLAGCDFVYNNQLENDSDTQSDVDDTELDTGPEVPKEYHKPLYMQEDPISPNDVTYHYNGVDLLLVVDDSNSMSEEQEMMATAVHTLVNALNSPLPGWPYPPVSSVRVGVISTDMGLVYGPLDTVPSDVFFPDCGQSGHQAQFIPGTIGTALNFVDMSIPCDGGDDKGCPALWNCVDPNLDNIGVCEAPGGDTLISCASVQAGELFATSSQDSINTDLGTEVACLANLGTRGCGIEQQLKAAARGAANNQDGFIRDDALLAVFLITDEEDCSIESDKLFDAPDFANLALGRINVACPNNPGYLTTLDTIKTALVDAKNGDDHAVVFGALAGVPKSDVCEGAGHLIDSCLNHQDMQFVEVVDPISTTTSSRPACERYHLDSLATQATPGRRIVSLVQEFEEYGYSYSICNSNFQPIMEDFSKQILRAMQPYDSLQK